MAFAKTRWHEVQDVGVDADGSSFFGVDVGTEHAGHFAEVVDGEQAEIVAFFSAGFGAEEIDTAFLEWVEVICWHFVSLVVIVPCLM